MVNICYWWSLMYLYRPFYQPDQTPGQINHDSRFTDLSIKMCDRAAHKIVQLIRIFEQSHGLRYFPRNMLQTIVACGTTLLLQGATVSESATKKRSTAQEGVNSCIRALREIASTWPYARQLAEQLEDSLSEQSHNSPISSPSAAPPSTSKVLAEQGSDDQDAPNTFYRFVHESGRDELESPYNSGVCSQNSSPMPPSAYAVLGKPPSDSFGPVSWEQLFRSTSPLSRHSVSTTHPPDNLFFDKGRE
ncbi:hypothetical protein FRC07_008267 [Ceratobasidium sp. 392]|nr:hypothetical protein FRC07_008267 [Ceratobasidium sp. 392]